MKKSRNNSILTNMEKPILFSTPMVQAILDGRKSQTRRIMKFVKKLYPENIKEACDEFDFWKMEYYPDQSYRAIMQTDENPFSEVSPYGKPGDILWVKEMYYAYGMWLKNGHAKSGKQKWRFFDTTLTGFKYHYCDNPPENILPNTKRETYGWFKRSSLFMPYKAHRINLEVTNIRVERLHDISESDAIAEGIEKYGPFGEYKGSKHPNGGAMRYRAYDKASRAYQDLWIEINGEKSWSSNPWVWVIEFKKL